MEDKNRTYKLYGFCRALVVDNNDELESGRVKVRVLPYMENLSEDVLKWAIPMFPYAGTDKGICFIPDVGDMVIVFHENGDIENPVYIGSASFVGNLPTECADPNKKVIKTASGKSIVFDDNSGGLLNINNGTNGAARLNDSITINGSMVTDANWLDFVNAFNTWAEALDKWAKILGFTVPLALPMPTSITGKINESSETVVIGD